MHENFSKFGEILILMRATRQNIFKMALLPSYTGNRRKPSYFKCNTLLLYIIFGDPLLIYNRNVYSVYENTFQPVLEKIFQRKPIILIQHIHRDF